MRDVSAPAFWEDIYARGGDGWELGRPAPPLVDLIETTPPPRGRVAVPGCGRGHDARFLAQHGYDVTGFDFSTAAVHAARTLADTDGVDVTFEQRDIFGLPADYTHAFDGAWEYTCYCAIDPRRRDAYVETLARIVRPGGWLLAVTGNAHNTLFVDQIGSAIGAYEFLGFPGLGLLLAWLVLARLERQSAAGLS